MSPILISLVWMDSSNLIILTADLLNELECYRFIGTSGENIDNLYCCTDGLDSLELLEKTLEWSHISPTCPDTLSKTLSVIYYSTVSVH